MTRDAETAGLLLQILGEVQPEAEAKLAEALTLLSLLVENRYDLKAAGSAWPNGD
jgi:hypothetical protein